MKTNNIVPKLRFPEFSGEWEVKKLGEIADRISKKNSNFAVEKVLTNSALEGVVEQSSFFEGKITTKGNLDNYFILNVGDFVYNPRISKLAPVGPISRNNIEKGIVSPLYFVFRFKNSYTDYYDYYFHTLLWHTYIKDNANKGARFDRISISAEKFMGLPIPYPSQQEQQKIADCLASLDELLDLEEKKLSALQKYKKGLMQKIFPQGESLIPELRFPEFTDKWERKKIKDVLSYEQPTNYIVNDNYLHKKGIPVLTANKSFILGYSNNKNNIYEKVPVIIFDDFTTDKKFVNFPFKVKSSAIKILKPIRGNNLKFIFNLLQLKNFSADEHKRYYIQIYQFLDITVPSIPEQQKIADFLSSVDELIENQEKKVEQLKQHKKGLLQGLFPNMNGVENV